MRYFEENPDSTLNRGLYLVKYTGEGREDNPNNPGLLFIKKGSCKFGQSLNLIEVKKRYVAHFKSEDDIEMHILARLRDIDDINALEKKLHHAFDSRRLVNSNNRKSEWMLSEDIETLKKEFKKIFLNHFYVE